MKGGVAGHAGLFGDANDLAMLMQLLVNGGTYGGQRYLSEAVVKEFTKCQFCAPNGAGNRRGLGARTLTARGRSRETTSQSACTTRLG